RVGQFFVAYRGWLPMQGSRDAKELYRQMHSIQNGCESGATGR
ncbi:DUF2787 domain-containing protein, partial [Vibrio anguillarum]|nr:DUF2787 domain-containing protein [Vibrio anguillarum]